jgi:hypothetical protein
MVSRVTCEDGWQLDPRRVLAEWKPNQGEVVAPSHVESLLLQVLTSYAFQINKTADQEFAKRYLRIPTVRSLVCPSD